MGVAHQPTHLLHLHTGTRRCIGMALSSNSVRLSPGPVRLPCVGQIYQQQYRSIRGVIIRSLTLLTLRQLPHSNNQPPLYRHHFFDTISRHVTNTSTTDCLQPHTLTAAA